MKITLLFSLILCLMSFLLVSCSSTSYDNATNKQEIINKHLSQGKRYLDGNFEEKFLVSGNDGINYKAIGRATYPLEYNEDLVRASAVADAKFKLSNGAPTEMKRLVQKAIGNGLGYIGEFSQIETGVTEIFNLQGIESQDEDVSCHIVVEPVMNGYKNSRECRALAKVPMNSLVEAYAFTVGQKYGIAKKNRVQEVLEEQMKGSFTPKATNPKEQ